MVPNGVSNSNPYAKVFDFAGSPPSREAVNESRRRVRLAESAFRMQRLSYASKMVESLSAGDWWTSALADRLQQWRTDPYWQSLGTSRHDRKHGRNYPLFRTELELSLIRLQSRILCSTNCYAVGLQEGIISYALGTGMSYRFASKQQERPAPDELLKSCQEIIDQFHERNAWFGGEQPGLEEELAWRSTEDGEWFLRHYAVEDGHTDLRVIEPEQITQPPGSGDEYLFGILTPRDDVAKHLKYNVIYDDTGMESDEVTADDVIAIRRNVKRNIKRGLPDYSFDTLDAFHVGNRLRHNMSLGAAIQATFAGVRQHETSTAAEVQGMLDVAADFSRINPNTLQNENVRRYEVGIEEVPKGMEWVPPPTATNAAAHVEILLACLRGAGRRWNAPDWLIAGDTSATTYAMALTGESPFVLRIRRHQSTLAKPYEMSAWIALRNWVIHHNGLRVRIAVKDANGEPTGQYGERVFAWQEIRHLVKLQVEAPNPEAKNKVEDANYHQVLRLNGIESVQTAQQKLGLDPEEELTNQEKYLEQTGGQGLALPIPKDKPGVGTDIILDPQLALQAALQPPKTPAAAQPAASAPAAPEAPPAPVPESRQVREQAEPQTLNVSDIRQADGYTCGLSALQAVLDYFGTSVEDDDLLKALGTTPANGTEPGPIAAYAKQAGLAVAAGPMTLDDLRQHLDAGHPVICCVQYDAPDGWASGHYVVLCGHDGDVLSLQDPARGRVRELADEFVRRWHDLAADGTRLEQYGIAVGRSDGTPAPMGKSDDWVSQKIAKLRGEGKSQDEAAAIAYSMAGRIKD